MWWNVGSHLKKRLRSECDGGHASTHAQAGADLSPRTLEGFLAILTRKFGSVTRAWRMSLDTDGSGSLTFREFTRGLKEVGYTGDFRSLWFQLDEDLSGSITLHELDPENAMRLEKFRVLCIGQHGSMEGAWHRVIDVDSSGTAGPDEFVEACQKLGHSGDTEEQLKLFVLLDCKKKGVISLEEVSFLQNWEDEKKRQVFASRLPTRWVNKDPYLSARPPKEPSQTLPPTSAAPSLLPDMSAAGSPVLPTTTFPSLAPPQKPGLFSATLSTEEEQSLRRIFRRGDKSSTNGKGSYESKVDFQTLQSTFSQDTQLQQNLSPKLFDQMQTFFVDVDADGSRHVTWEEFRAYYVRFIRSNNSESTPRRPISKASATSAMPTVSSPRPAFFRKLSFSNRSPSSLPGTMTRDEDWSAPAGADSKNEWDAFQSHMVKKYGCLATAFDAMDNNGSGSLSMVEFQSAVCGSMHYCSARDGKRLFLGAVPDGGAMTWKEFGVSQQEWGEHLHGKRQQALQRRAQGGSSGRAEVAFADHLWRKKNPQSAVPFSFGSPLGKGWGLPPYLQSAPTSSRPRFLS